MPRIARQSGAITLIRKRFCELRLHQKAIAADILGKSPQNLSGKLTGKLRLSSEHARALAQLVGGAVEDFFYPIKDRFGRQRFLAKRVEIVDS